MFMEKRIQSISNITVHLELNVLSVNIKHKIPLT